jgi:acetolactate synthase-1/2/3 large subunit
MFARDAKKIMVDIEPEIIEHSSVTLDLSICMSIHDFVGIALNSISIEPKDMEWQIKVCCVYAIDYPFRPMNKRYVDAYNFYERLDAELPNGTVLVADQGATFYAWSQSFFVGNTISFTNGGFSPMGYALPAAIGACIANGRKPTVCVIGDGGFEMNIQELQTIAHYNLPIKIFVFSNNGYGSIRNTQDANFNGRYVGSDPTSGVSCVDVFSIAEAYNIGSYAISSDMELDVLELAFKLEGPVLIDIKLDPNQKIEPKVVATKNADGSLKPGLLEDMTPLLDRDVFRKLMIVKPVEG